ncbi:MAG: TIGR02587 family membrane protein [Burkholderiales bacterium]
MSHPSFHSSNLSIAQSLREYGRGIAGGLLVSLPLLYTQEMWHAGISWHPAKLILYVAATFVLLLGYNRYAGLHGDATFAEIAIDSVEEMGLGVLIAALILWLIGRITLDSEIFEATGQVVMQAMQVAIGVSIGTAQLGGGSLQARRDGGRAGKSEDGKENVQKKGEAQGEKRDPASAAETPLRERQVAPGFRAQVVIATCGAVLIAGNVAPTDEIMIIAIASSPWRILGLAALSVAIATSILYFSEFRGSKHLSSDRTWLSITTGAVLTYAIALATSAAILWFFDRFEHNAIGICIAQTVVLAVAASLGASAGRLLLLQHE